MALRLGVLLLVIASCHKPPAPKPPQWSDVPLSGGGHLNGLSVIAADDIWGVSRPDVFHYDGKQWAKAGSPGAEHLAAAAHDDVWGVGRGGSWSHFDGKQWSNGPVTAAAEKYRDFYGVAAWPGRVWATAGASGTYFANQADGGWTEVQPPELAGWELKRISAIGAHAYVALSKSTGESGKKKFEAALGHFDGARWEVLSERPGLWVRGSAPDDVWIVMGKPRHFDGTAWADTPLPEGSVPFDIFSRSKTEAYLVGKGGLAMKWDGKAWSELPSGTSHDLFAVIGGAEGPVWAAGVNDKMLRYVAGSSSR